MTKVCFCVAKMGDTVLLSWSRTNLEGITKQSWTTTINYLMENEKCRYYDCP